MADHCGYVVQIKEIRKHENADRLQIATIFGNNVIVGLSVHEGDIGVYFPSGLQLSERFCTVNDLVRRKDENGNNVGGFLDPDKRNIKCLKLRGEKSDGLWLPLICLADFCTISDLKVGDTIDVVNGEQICCKYIPKRSKLPGKPGSRNSSKPKVNFAPTFYEHVDTEQLAYHLDAFKNGDIIQLTLKMHGTSGRTGYLPLIKTKRSLLDKLLRRHGKDYFEYGYVTGTRRVVLSNDRHGGYYGSDDFRHEMAKKFEGKLRRGEVAYYEIVGFQGPNGNPIMAAADNSKVNNKAFQSKYGSITVFSYGCSQTGQYEPMPTQDLVGNDCIIPPCCEVYVYRMTMVNEDGDVVEYSPDQIRERCEQMNVNYVKEFERFIIPDDCDPGEYILRRVERYFDGPDPIGHTHVREGVVIRICNRTKFAVYKHKNFSFKLLEGIVTDSLTDEQMQNMSQDILEEL